MIKNKSSFTKKDLNDSSLGSLFTYQTFGLPKSPMMMVDRIITISSDKGNYNKGFILAEMDIQPDLWFFECHFHNDPVMPGCLGLDGLWQLAGFHMGWLGMGGKGRALGVDSVKFSNQITPDKTLVQYIVDVKRIYNGKLKMIVADGIVKCDGEIYYTATGLKVGLI